jgi:hypothetical protein
MGKTEGKEVPDEADELLEEVFKRNIRADYRKSLGKEHARASWDLEIGKIFRRGKDKDEDKK